METESVMGVVLAGGQGRRMGERHKAFVELAGKPLISHVISRLGPQTADLVISANQQQDRLGAYGYAVIPDTEADCGPLAGVLAVMAHVRRQRREIKWLLTAAVDSPLFPHDYGARMWAGLSAAGAGMACAASNGRLHPVFALWPLSLHDTLKQAVEEGGVRGAGRFIRGQDWAEVDFSDPGRDPFFNINTEEDLIEAARFL